MKRMKHLIEFQGSKYSVQRIGMMFVRTSENYVMFLAVCISPDSQAMWHVLWVECMKASEGFGALPGAELRKEATPYGHFSIS
jgi:hypothetical protein